MGQWIESLNGGVMNFDPILSQFRSATDPETVVDAPLSAIIARVRSTELAERCAEIRRVFQAAGGGSAGKDAIRELKKALPGVTITGVFKRRSNAAWREPSMLVGIDLDDLDEAELCRAWRELTASPSVAFLHRSASGSGLKGAVRVPGLALPDAQRYSLAWQAVSLWLLSLGVENDAAVKDVSRLSFLAHDPDAYWNPEATTFDLDRWAPPTPIDPQPMRAAGALRPGDDFNQRGDLATLLAHHGWTLDRDGENQQWCRPGKTSGCSATLKDRVFYVFTSNAPPFEPNRAYSAFAVLALLQHGGDFQAAARELNANGYGDRPVAAATPTLDPAPTDPGPLPPDLLRVPGFVSEVMDHCLATAPYPNHAMAFCGALSLLAFLAGRKVREPGGLRTNIYLLGLAHSASGKDWPRKINTKILHLAGLSDCLGDRFASGEGLQDALFVHPCMLFQTDEIDGLLQSINKAQDARHEAIMGALLTLYTSTDSVVPMRRKAGQPSPGVIDQPNLVIFGTAIPNHYYEALSRRMLTNGLFARMIVIEGGKRGAGQDARPIDPPESIINIARFWADYRPATGNLDREHPTPATVPIDESASRILAQCRHDADTEYRQAEANADAVGTTVWGRVGEQSRKLALLYAISVDHRAPCIDATAATWATRFVLHQTRRMLAMAGGHVADNPFHAECLKLIEKLRVEPERRLPHSTALKRMKTDAQSFQRIIDTLVQQGDIEVVSIPRAGSSHRFYALVSPSNACSSSSEAGSTLVETGLAGVKPDQMGNGG